VTVIASNTAALRATNAATRAEFSLSQAMQRLSSGKRINTAKDDAAGLAIATKMTAEIRGLTAATRNANDALSMLAVAESAKGEISNILQRMRELAVQSASGTVTDTVRTYIQKEVAQLKEQITDIATRTSFNGITMLNGSTGANLSVSITIQTGSKAGDTMDLSITAVNLSGLGLVGPVDLNDDGDAVDTAVDFDGAVNATDLNETNYSLDLSTQEGSLAALSRLEEALKSIYQDRASLGGQQSRLEAAVKTLNAQITNLTDARSRIADTDFSEESTALARAQILSQASNAMLAQANQSQQGVLSLIR
jgi:flagellin